MHHVAGVSSVVAVPGDQSCDDERVQDALSVRTDFVFAFECLMLFTARCIGFQNITQYIEAYATPLVEAEKSILINVIQEPENLFERESNLAKESEHGGFVGKCVHHMH